MKALLDRVTTLLTQSVRHGVAWWIGELAALLPWRFRTDPTQARVLLHVSADASTLRLRGRDATDQIEIPIDPDHVADASTAVRAALRARRLPASVVIRLDPGLLLDADLTLPAAARQAMRPILFNQLERVVPLPANDVAFAYSIDPHTGAEATLRVHLTIVARATITQAIATATALGLAPRSVVAPGQAAWDATPVELWHPGRATETTPTRRRVYRGLEIAAIGFAVVAFVAYLERLDTQIAQLQEQVRTRTRLAAVARELTVRQQQIEATLAVLRDRQREPTPLNLLNAVTELVPHDSWLAQVSVRGRTIEIIGFSDHVADLVNAIENHDNFWEPQFRAPITQTPDGRHQRFNLSFEYWQEGDP